MLFSLSYGGGRGIKYREEKNQIGVHTKLRTLIVMSGCELCMESSHGVTGYYDYDCEL